MQPGDNVKVTGGRHAGRTGRIVRTYSAEGFKWLEDEDIGLWWEVRLGDGMRYWIRGIGPGAGVVVI